MSNRETELGTLIVVVLKARNLNDKHSLYKQDVFAQLTLNGTTKKTKVAVRGGQHPEWDEEIRYPVLKQSGDEFRKLEVACYAKEPRSDDILGKGELDITDTLKTGEFDDWVPLNIDGVVRGDLYIEMTFYSNGAVPIPPPSASSPSYAALLNDSKKGSPKLDRISHTQADPPSGASRRPLHPSSHLSGSLAPEPHQPINHLVPAQNVSLPPVNESFATAALHNLLSDPVTSQQPPINAYYSSQGPHARSSSTLSAQRADPPLPTLRHEGTSPAELPSTLLPGGRTHSQQTPSHPFITSHIPSTLRAGVGRVVSSPNSSQHIPAHMQRSFARSTTNHTMTIGNTHISPRSTNTYSPPSFSANTSIAQPPCGVTVAVTSQPWHQETIPSESFSLPIPMPHVPAPGELNGSDSYVPPLVSTNYTYTSPLTGNAAPLLQADHPLPPPKSGYPQSSYTSSAPMPTSHHWQQSSLQDNLSDSFHQARYSTPLPLPQSLSHDQQSLSSSTTTPDLTRIKARQVDKDAEQSKTQDEKDHELALALDRELNL